MHGMSWNSNELFLNIFRTLMPACFSVHVKKKKILTCFVSIQKGIFFIIKDESLYRLDRKFSHTTNNDQETR